MTTPPPSRLPPGNPHLQAIQVDTLRRVARDARAGTVGWLALACALVYIGFGRAPDAALFTWALAYGVYLIARQRVAAGLLARSDSPPLLGLRQWRLAFAGVGMANGLLLGTGCAFMIWQLPLPDKLLVTLLGVAAGASAFTTHLRRTASRLFLIFLLPPMAAAWLVAQGIAGWQPALVLLAVYAAYDMLVLRQDDAARERMKYSVELAEANARFEATSRSRIRLVAEASHDLRQPVQTLVMMLDRLDPRARRDEIARRCMAIRECAHKVTDMLADVLDLSRFDLGEIAADIQDVSLVSTLEDIETTYAAQARMKGLEWAVSPARCWVRTDPHLFTRVLGNLVSNAIKYTDKGAVAITCKIDGDLVRIAVIDTGVGIPKGSEERIFEQNVRLNADQHPGHGIGLAIVSRACRLLGHPLTVESAPGAGSRFTITVPVSAVQEPQPDSFLNSGHFQPRHDKLVVFLEDDKRLRSSTTEVLETLGLTVVAAASVAEAMRQPVLHQRRPDLLISDMHLSGDHDGLQAVRDLRAEYPSSPVPAILLTGDLAPELRERARAEAVRVAYKPIRPSRLKEMVTQCLDGTYPASEPMALS